MLTVAWDVDDVLSETMRTWFEAWWTSKNGDYRLDYEDIRENPPHEILGIERATYLQSLDAFRLSEVFQKMPPNSAVYQWFKQYGKYYRHMALTAVPRAAAAASAAWAVRNFGDWIHTFHFVPSARPGDIPTTYESTKAGYLKWLNRIDIFIDDNEKDIQEVSSLGIRCFLVSQPWNSGGMKIEEVLESLTLACKDN